MAKVVKATLVLAFVGLVVGGWVYHSARAQVDESLMGLGEQMMAYDDALHQDAPRQLVLNGQIIHLSSGTTTDGPMRVLDVFEERCGAVDGELSTQMQQFLEEHPDAQRELPPSPVLRRDNGRRGYVACLDLGEESVPVTELAQRLGQFGETGDVGAIGDVRYVFAEPTERGAHFVTMWTTGELNVRRMFPSEGDAPGRDVPQVSRPPQARRLLSGYEQGEPQSMTVYHTREGEASLENFYRRDLDANGWSLLEIDESAMDPNGPRTLIAERGDRMVIVMFQPDIEQGGSTTAIFDAR